MLHVLYMCSVESGKHTYHKILELYLFLPLVNVDQWSRSFNSEISGTFSLMYDLALKTCTVSIKDLYVLHYVVWFYRELKPIAMCSNLFPLPSYSC